ncbi:MAG: 30S ribosomal protein S3 [Mycoplasma sp.]|nr:30S ribosomal protein S3 [Mycoplasma sp.]
MGQKVNPNGFRYGITKKHESVWYADKSEFSIFLLEDQRIREYIEMFIRKYQIGGVELERNQQKEVKLTLYSSKPGILLGENGQNLEKFIKGIQKHTRNRKLKLNAQVITIEKPELNARLVAEEIAIKLENRGSFRIAQKQAMRAALFAGAKGVKTQVSGRLNGADMARAEGYQEGIMALHTLRNKVSYAQATARTTYGAIGIKVWISLGEELEGNK